MAEPERPLRGKVAVVTGAGWGAGRAHCVELARLGAAVVVNEAHPRGSRSGRSRRSVAADVAAAIRACGGRAVADDSQVGDGDASAALVQRALCEFGRLDVLVNSSGIVRSTQSVTGVSTIAPELAPWAAVPDGIDGHFGGTELDPVSAARLRAAFAMTWQACAHWCEQSRRGLPVTGRIINTAVAADAMRGDCGLGDIGAPLTPVARLTLATASRMAHHGVTVNAIAPVLDSAFGAACSSGVVAWLASDDSTWLTGRILRVDGDALLRMLGWSAGTPTWVGRAAEWARYA